MTGQMMLPESPPIFAEGLYVCLQCGEPFEPYKRAEGRQVYCTPECRDLHREVERKALKPPVQNPDRGTRAERVLVRLRQGPATGLELLQAGGGTCYRDQVWALRKMGHRILGTRSWTDPEGNEVPAICLTDDGHDRWMLEE